MRWLAIAFVVSLWLACLTAAVTYRKPMPRSEVVTTVQLPAGFLAPMFGPRKTAR